MNAEVEGMSIVLVGAFNPAILHPEWFTSRGLVRSGDAQVALTGDTKPIVSHEITSFRLPWANLQVTPEQFQITCADPGEFSTMRELVQGTFTLLEQTPIRMLGLNSHRHFRCDSVEKWHAIGNRLAPKQPWESILGNAPQSDHPGLISLKIRGTREASSAQHIDVSVAPSARVVPGVFVSTNEHYDFSPSDPAGGYHQGAVTEMQRILESEWTQAVGYARHVAGMLMGGAG